MGAEQEAAWSKKHYNPFASVPAKWEVSPRWSPGGKIRVRERKTSDWDYERYFEVGSWEELMEYLRNKYWRWVIEFREKEPEPKLKSEKEYDVEVEMYDMWRE